MVAVLLFEHPADVVAVAVYVVVEDGVAITVVPVVTFNPALGVHTYDAGKSFAP
jgi:hypothetical protein